MTTRLTTNPSTLWDPGVQHLSQCVVVTEPKTFIYLSGQTAIDEHGNLGEDDFDAQVRLCFDNIRRGLASADADLTDIVSLTVYFTDIGNLDAYTAVLAELIPIDAPTQTVVQVAQLALPALMIEITAQAVL